MEGAAFDSLAQVTVEAALLMSAVLIVGVALLGLPLVALLLGVKYANLAPLLLWLAISQAVRVMKAGPAIVALARGETSNAMWANVARVVVLPLIWWAAVQGADLVTLIWIGIAGEVLGYAVALGLLAVRCGFLVRTVVRGHLGIMVVLVAAVFDGAWVWVTLSIAFILTLWTLRHLRGHIRK